MKTLTVDFTPEQVAGEIIRVVNGSGRSYLLGAKAKMLGFLAKILPARLGRRVVMHVTGY